MSYAGEVEMGHIDPARLGPGEYAGVAPEFFVVLYRPGDWLGLACAVLSLVPPMILIAHLAVFLARRQASDLWFAGGQVVCEASNKVFKHLLAQPRPPGPVANMPQDSFGMPSAHSQFMGYVAAYTLLQLARDAHIPRAERLIRAALVVAAAGAVGFSRFYLFYHSAGQVLGGLGAGAALAAAWYVLGGVLRRLGVFAWGLELWPCRLLCVKDSSYDVRAEYREWRAQQGKRAE